MATLTIRNLPDAVRDKLRIRAAENGRSMEAEARAVLERELEERPPLDVAERRRRVDAIQAALAPYRVPGLLASEELIAERRLEAWRETVESMEGTRRRGGPPDLQAAADSIKRVRGGS